MLSALADDLTGYQATKSARHFAPDQPLPVELVRKLIDTRMREVEGSPPETT